MNLVIKIGTNVITQDSGLLDMDIMEHLVYQIAEAKKRKLEVVLITSGAMGAGKSLIKLPDKAHDVVKRQILASIGQIKLINTYAQLFNKHNLVCAQILATKEDFRDKIHYHNMLQCFQALLSHNIIPIVNENDVVSVSELMFTDNDELAGLIASMLNSDILIMLSSVDGIMSKDSDGQSGKAIPLIDLNTFDPTQHITPQKSMFGRGGMLTKCATAHKLATLGITTYIANGKKKNTVLDILDRKSVGTKFIPFRKLSPVKRWIAQSEGREKASVIVNQCARDVLTSKEKASSLLPVGILAIQGEFETGDLVKIKDESGKQIGLGQAQYNSKTAQSYLGQKNKKPLVHYDYLFIKT